MSTTSLGQRISNARPAAGEVGAWWLGGSGFIFKTPAGQQIWIDPYLSDVVRELFGMGRAFPAPITVEEATPDVVICTHMHEDHLDPVTIPALARRRPSTKFLMGPVTMSHALHAGLPTKQVELLAPGQTIELGGVKLTGVVARHEAQVPGWETPDAFGVVFDFGGGLKAYHTGDTDYDSRIHRALAGTSLAFATLCINGSVGNMNAHEAALLASQLDAKSLIPHHHLIWSRPPEKIPIYETLDPNVFAATYRLLKGKASVVIPEVGRDMKITPTGIAFA
jgi:L-ascorbate 6-phosphate lactonase